MNNTIPLPGLNSSQLNKPWPDADRLDSWKEIANYLRREVRTVQLWEKKEGLPVHRHFHKRLGSVFALRSEIENWRHLVSRKGGDPALGLVPLSPPKNSQAPIAIRVSPLKNLTSDSHHLRICDSIVSDTIAALEEWHPGRVRIVDSKVSIQSDQAEFPDKVGAEEAIGYVLNWTLRENRTGLQLNVALLPADSDVAVWSHTYFCRLSDRAEMPAYVAGQIVQCLWLKVFSSSTSFRIAPRREGSGAREAYLKGRYFWNLRNEEALRKALQCFESAIRKDPEFALPYSGLADSLTLLSFYEIVSPFEAMPSARRAALKAIELDPNLAEAHASLADILLHFDRDWQAADQEYRRAIQCNPGYALGYHWYANLLSARGQHEAAHIAIMQALEIDPVSIITLVWAGVTSHLAHRFDEAIKHYQSALELDPQFIWAHMYMAQALEQKADFKGALREFEATIRLAGGNDCVKAMKAHAHAAAGDRSSARAILHELNHAPSYKCMPSYDIAATYAGLGEGHNAFLWLNRACDERNMKLFTLTHDRRFDPLRNRTEFKEIVTQMGLAQHRLSRS